MDLDLDETLSEDIPENPTNEQLKEKLVQYYQKIDRFEQINDNLIESLEFLKSKYNLVKVDKEQLQNLNDCLEEKYVEQCEINEKIQFEKESLMENLKKMENVVELERIKSSKIPEIRKQQEQLRTTLIRVLEENLEPLLKNKSSISPEPIQNLDVKDMAFVIQKLESDLTILQKSYAKQESQLKSEIKNMEEKQIQESTILNRLEKGLTLEFERKEKEVLREKEDSLRKFNESEKKLELTWKELRDTTEKWNKDKNLFREREERKKKENKMEMEILESKIRLLEKKVEYLRLQGPRSTKETENQNNVTLEIESQMKREIMLEQKVKELEKENKKLSTNNALLMVDLEEVKLRNDENERKNEEFSVIIGEYSDVDDHLSTMEEQFESIKNIVDEILPTKSLMLRRVIEKFKILMKEVKTKTGKNKKNISMTLSKFE